MKKNNSGFSLVELIIVIAIMAVLIGVLAPQFIKYVERSRESTDLQNIEEIKTAAEAYVADKGLGKDDTITVKVEPSKATITVSTDATEKLAEYGIDPDKIKLKGKWKTPDDVIEWEYKGYKWTIKQNPTGAAFKADGTDATAKTED